LFYKWLLPILVVSAPNVITHGVVVHKIQHPVPSLLLHVTDIAVVVFSTIIHNANNISMLIILNYDNDVDNGDDYDYDL
jgi:hypothetical protein